ncbi:hypothetical protein PTSG_07072 [Salpingoeca rosetta]|uniref:Uncharacterized protein n=1 Tax=Salpingoeca rosetta (strain ATCC 50818 / BSB-021) TaxID=946362 RepID=F2UDZ2_SALR5|nr:uncharacterized protein PTSG_07072 [Salpingoeca rosetta]EGD74842.1 hypothetical protein PTSG_07072 [Salpingoeca rosetta]|eukprot:XP_004992487.1 hypothetical protein PTSG_07072 [Salpingoeca rosetta]
MRWTWAVEVLLVAVAAVAVTSAVAMPVEDGVIPARLVLGKKGNSSCLTPKQDDELRHAIAGIQITLSAAVTALDIAAAAEHNAKTKQDLKEAAVVIQNVNKYLVANLTQIVDSACGNCSEIVRVVNESATAIEQTISHISPDIKNTTTWKLIVTAINDILQIAEIVCPSKLAMFHMEPRDVSPPCLNATQLRLLEKIVAGTQIIMTSAEVALEVAAANEKDNATRHKLEEAATVVKAISQDLVGNLTKIAQSPCATCTEIVNIVEQLVHALEETLQQINPDWNHDPLWQSIVEAINNIFQYVEVLCPQPTQDTKPFHIHASNP